jgi:hypothetical protein
LPSAVLLAAVGSGVPSTARDLVRNRALLASTRAAGTLLVGDAAAPTTKVIGGVAAHFAISSFWGTVLWFGLPRRHTVAWGALAGVAIAGLDLGVIGSRLPVIRELDLGPQLADHVAFGVIVGWARTQR